MSDKPTCGLCGEPMPAGEEMFMYHGHSGPCPKPPIDPTPSPTVTVPREAWERMRAESMAFKEARVEFDKPYTERSLRRHTDRMLELIAQIDSLSQPNAAEGE